MKRYLLLFLLFCLPHFVNAEVLEAGVSVEEVPNALYGSWRVNAKLEDTNALSVFKPQSVDFWTLSRVGDKITLDNPFSGANAEISVRTVEGNLVVFSKKLPYDGNKVLTDTVTLRLSENEFNGINSLTLESFSLIDNHLMKTQTAKYVIKGEKISGDSVLP
ncbi:MAG: hypothetical protein NC191_10155 [Muribaculaceae bacterium]|nr:hypothetical protein [Muribaculaceae bacterium]